MCQRAAPCVLSVFICFLFHRPRTAWPMWGFQRDESLWREREGGALAVLSSPRSFVLPAPAGVCVNEQRFASFLFSHSSCFIDRAQRGRYGVQGLRPCRGSGARSPSVLPVPSSSPPPQGYVSASSALRPFRFRSLLVPSAACSVAEVGCRAWFRNLGHRAGYFRTLHSPRLRPVSRFGLRPSAHWAHASSRPPAQVLEGETLERPRLPSPRPPSLPVLRQPCGDGLAACAARGQHQRAVV